MTPADEAFIALWQQGLETAAIAERLGIKATTAQSRAHRLQARGLIQPRSRGGDYPSRRAQARQGTVHDAVQSSAVYAPMHGAEPV